MTSSSPLTIESLPELPQPNADWQQLGLEAGNPFSTWEWASAWWRSYGGGRTQRLLGCRDAEGRLIGILPLYFASRRPLRILRFIGHGQAGQLGPICRPEDRAAVAEAFRRGLAGQRDWDACVAERLNSTDGWPQLIGGITTRVEPSPTIRFETSDWEKFLASKSANFRQQARRQERRLERDYSLSYRLAQDPDRLEEDMDRFFSLHESRWASGGGSSVFLGERSRFHRQLARLALSAGWLRLSFLELDGVPRAAIYCFRLGGADWYFQAGRDPAFDSDRVGYVLLNRCVREALEAGMGEFKLLLGEHEYKSRYATDEPPVETRVLTRGRVTASALRIAVPARRALLDLRERAAQRARQTA